MTISGDDPAKRPRGHRDLTGAFLPSPICDLVPIYRDVDVRTRSRSAENRRHHAIQHGRSEGRFTTPSASAGRRSAVGHDLPLWPIAPNDGLGVRAAYGHSKIVIFIGDERVGLNNWSEFVIGASNHLTHTAAPKNKLHSRRLPSNTASSHPTLPANPAIST